MKSMEPGIFSCPDMRAHRLGWALAGHFLLLQGATGCRQQEAAAHLLASQEVSQTAVSTPVPRQQKKKIYFTFDDGPNAGTGGVYQIIKELNVPVTFFLVARHAEDSREQREIQKMLFADSSIECSNHSYSHAANRYSRFYRNPDNVVADMRRADSLMNYRNRIVRMPGRNAWRIDSLNVTDIASSRSAIDSVYAAGFDVMGWDIEWTFDHRTFAPDPDTALLVRRIVNLLEAGTSQTPGHVVILAHDQAFRQKEYGGWLKEVILRLKENPEYELAVASRYPGLRK